MSRYLQVLTQAKKMGRETISSQELADYTHVNSTQIRRDLSGFGKFGKRGVGYNVDSLVSQIRKILRSTGKHNIALFGAGNLGQAIAGSDIFADHGFRVVALFDKDPGKVGGEIGDNLTVRPYEELERVIREEDVVVGVLAVPTDAAQEVADDLVEVGGLNQLGWHVRCALVGLLRRPARHQQDDQPAASEKQQNLTGSHLGTFLKVKKRFPPKDPSFASGIETKLPPGW